MNSFKSLNDSKKSLILLQLLLYRQISEIALVGISESI